MPEIVISKKKQLDEWESRLKQMVGEGELLLGELGFNHQDLDEIGQLLAREAFLRQPINRSLSWVKAWWSLTYALYLVLEGIYNYESGNYWDGPCKQLALQGHQTSDCGRLFLDILVQFNLPTFEQSGGLKYVTPILLHGGIPNNSLSHFFDFLWQQEKKHYRISLDSVSLLQIWRQAPEEYFPNLPKAARRFLEHGGSVAEDFVDRCLDLFDTESFAEAELLIDLPKRIIRTYWQWRGEKGIVIRSSAPRIRLQRPILTIAPYTSGIDLYLPAQQFHNQDAPQELAWQFTNTGQIINCRRQRVEGGYQFEVEQKADIAPAEQYILHLSKDGSELQSWTLPGLNDPPILFFAPYDAYSGDALTDHEKFRPGERWLLYPEAYQWKTTGASRKISDLPRLGGSWQKYKLEAWRLAPGSDMVLRGKDGREYCFAIINEKVRHRPHLQGGNRLLLPTSAADFPLYIGRPPTLMLYVKQPHRWQMAVRAAGGAQPGGHRQKPLSQLRYTQLENGLGLDLALPELLSETAVGKFEIVLRGPLGQSYHLGLWLIPALTVDGLQQLYLANVNETAHFQLACDHATQIRQNPPQAGVELQPITTDEKQRAYQITAEPQIKQLHLQLRHDSGVIIPLTIPIYRLRWGLWHGKDDTITQWQTEPSAIYPGNLPKGELWVDAPMLPIQQEKERQLRVGWQLINAQGKIWREVRPDEQPVQSRLKWSLGELTAVWRERQETLCWQLIIQQPDHDEPLIIPAFYLLPTLDFGDLTYEWQTDKEQVNLTLLWEQSQPGIYRLQLWPLDRPWITAPISLQLPDTAETMAEWRLPHTELPPEAYLAELSAYNPWQSAHPQRPQPGTPNSLLIKPPGLSQHYAEIIRLRDRGQASVEQLLALLAHQFYNSQRNELHATNKAIADQRETISLVWLIRWLELAASMDMTAYKLAQIRAFDGAIIDRLAQQSWSDEDLDSYFQHLSERLSEKVYVWVIQSGLRRPRRRCLTAACRLLLDTPERETTVQTAIQAVLEDVCDGLLLLQEGADILTPNAQIAANHLAQDGSLDAADLLFELASRANLAPNWIAPKRRVETNLGVIQVDKLRRRVTNEIRFCALLEGDCYAEGKLLAFPTDVAIRLDLHNRLLRFTETEPYRCQHCQQLFKSMADHSQHHKLTHAAQQPARKRLKRDCSIAWLRPQSISTSEEDQE